MGGDATISATVRIDPVRSDDGVTNVPSAPIVDTGIGYVTMVFGQYPPDFVSITSLCSGPSFYVWQLFG